MNIRDYRTELERQKGRREQIQEQISAQTKTIKSLIREKRVIEKAQVILQEVARLTQEELRYHVNDLVSLALSGVFEDPYELDLDFVVRRSRTEADIWFKRDGESVHPMTASGGGAVDVASFALRVALWSLSVKKGRAVLFLDEPFKFLSSDYQLKAGTMMQKISERLGLQLIMVSHIQDLIETAHRVFSVSMKRGVSEVREMRDSLEGSKSPIIKKRRRGIP